MCLDERLACPDCGAAADSGTISATGVTTADLTLSINEEGEIEGIESSEVSDYYADVEIQQYYCSECSEYYEELEYQPPKDCDCSECVQAQYDTFVETAAAGYEKVWIEPSPGRGTAFTTPNERVASYLNACTSGYVPPEILYLTKSTLNLRAYIKNEECAQRLVDWLMENHIWDPDTLGIALSTREESS